MQKNGKDSELSHRNGLIMCLFLQLIFLCLPIVLLGGVRFLHIPKTGGLTIYSLLEQQYRQNEIYPYRDAGQLARNTYDANVMLNRLNAFPPIEQKLALGHFPFWFFQHKDLHFHSSYFVTVLRDPVDRVISSYFYRLATEDLQSPLEVTPNRMCKMLCSDASLREEELLQDCIQNLQRMDFIIFMDDFEEGVRRLFKRLDLGNLKEVPKRNQSLRSEISEEIRKKIAAANALDVRLYEYASKNLRYKSY